MADRRYPPEDTETVFCLERKYKTNDKESVGIDFGTSSKAYNRKETKTKTKKHDKNLISIEVIQMLFLIHFKRKL